MKKFACFPTSSQILAKQLQIVLTGQPELREVLNTRNCVKLQRVRLRCVIKALPNVAETDRYIMSRLLVSGVERTTFFLECDRLHLSLNGRAPGKKQ